MRHTDILLEDYARTPRFQLVNNQWYFNTREEERLGPYDSLDDVNYGVELYIALMSLDGDLAA